ncbi:MAG: hypothetical protein WCR01_11075 [Bacteroidota bacterium]
MSYLKSDLKFSKRQLIGLIDSLTIENGELTEKLWKLEDKFKEMKDIIPAEIKRLNAEIKRLNNDKGFSKN